MKSSNKILAIFFASMLIIAAFVFSVGADYTAPVLGDLNGDGEIKTTDARLALRAAVKIEELSALQTKCADVNFDGSVKTADARAILRAAVKIESLKEAPIGWFDEFTETESTTPKPTITLTAPPTTKAPAPTTGEGILATGDDNGEDDPSIDAGELF